MATLMSNSSGNFTASGTWSLVDSTSYLNSEAGTTNSTTTFTNCSPFTPGAITIDGIAIKVSAHTLVGTFSVRLVTGGGAAGTTTGSAVAGTTVTINTADLPTVNTTTQNGWTFLKFSSPVTLLAATAYNVQIQSSSASTVTLYRDATASNWSRALRTTTTQSPAASDELLINGEYISAGSNNSFTVTMDNTATTTFGILQISAKGILNWDTTASTNYYLKLQGNLTSYSGSTYQMGTSGTPIPSTSTAKLEFACTTNVEFGFDIRTGATVTTFGNALSNVSALLAADASASATSLTTNISTGWKNGDVIALASTTRTASESESKALTADASGTTLSITALTNAHLGTSPTQAELINLTRNVQIFGTSTTNQSYIVIGALATISFNNTEFYQLGSATASKRGIDVPVTTGSFTADKCSFHDYIVTSSLGLNLSSTSGNNITVTNNVFYNINSNHIVLAATSGTNITINNNIGIRTVAASAIFSIASMKITFTNNMASGSASTGIAFSDTTWTSGTISGNTSHSNAGTGITLTNVTCGMSSICTFLNSIVWRNTLSGLSVANSFAFVIDTLTAFGNATASISFITSVSSHITFKNITSNSGSTLTSPVGINLAADCHNSYIDNSSFGATTIHATADINAGTTNTMVELILRNTTLASTNQIAGISTNAIKGSTVKIQKLNSTSGNHKTFYKFGSLIRDTTIYNSGPASTRLTPNSSTNKVESPEVMFCIANGQTGVVTVFLRKSIAGDGSAYNGNQPRLILKADPAMGINSDVVLATADNTYNGVFKALSGTTPAITDNGVYRIVVDCDGTSGWINIDDWAVQ